MSIECTKCKGRAQTYLCNGCTAWLRQRLLGMPTLIDRLRDTAIGNTRLSNEASRPMGFESRTFTFDDRASALIEEIDGALYRWVKRMTWRHGYLVGVPISWHRPDLEYVHTSYDYAVFLAAHVADLANDEYVGELCDVLRSVVNRSVGGREEGGLLQRRTPDQFCGPCPATISDHRRCVDQDGVKVCCSGPHTCATQLMSPRGAVEVTCPSCGAVHRVQKLVDHLLAHSDEHKFIIPVLYTMMRMLGTPVDMSTLYRWAEPRNSKRSGSGQLRPAGYLRPDGRRIGVSRHSDQDKPVYLVGDVRSVAAKKRKAGRPLGSKNKGDKG